MDDVEFVEILNASNDLLENFAGLNFGNSNLNQAYFLHLTM